MVARMAAPNDGPSPTTTAEPAKTRHAGILLHPTSLPSPHGVGDLGDVARRFVDWLADAGLTRWQVLPLVPAGGGNSPYGTMAALAGHPLLVSLHGLARALKAQGKKQEAKEVADRFAKAWANADVDLGKI